MKITCLVCIIAVLSSMPALAFIAAPWKLPPCSVETAISIATEELHKEMGPDAKSKMIVVGANYDYSGEILKNETAPKAKAGAENCWWIDFRETPKCGVSARVRVGRDLKALIVLVLNH